MSSQKVSLKDIALEAGVVVSDVLKVVLKQKNLDYETENRVLIAMRNLNYGNPAGVEPKTVAVITSGSFASGDYITEVLQGIYEQARALGYTLQLGSSNNTENFIAPIFEDRTLQGVIILVPVSFDQTIAECNEHHKPFVLIDYEGNYDVSQTPLVLVNDREAMFQITDYLIQLGHRRIGFIAGRLAIHTAQERLYGYQDALDYHQIPLDESLIIEGSWLEPSGYQGGKQLLDLDPHPTAIIASNDLMAYGVMEAIHERGLRVGDDISLTGFDDLILSQSTTPSLTTARQPMHEIGQTGVMMLHDLLQGRTPDPIHVRLGIELIIRDSTNPPRR